METARNKEPADGRLLQHLLKSPSSEDGGQWDMLVGLVEKYGVMPQSCFPDTWNSESSRRLGQVMNSKVRQVSSSSLDLTRLPSNEHLRWLRTREPLAYREYTCARIQSVYCLY